MKITRFEKFLINRNLLEIFKYNLKHHRGHRDCETISSLMKYKHPIDLIEGGFTWGSTPEGHSFWRAVDREWYECLKNNKL